MIYVSSGSVFPKMWIPRRPIIMAAMDQMPPLFHILCTFVLIDEKKKFLFPF